jgi:hypothetical protein
MFRSLCQGPGLCRPSRRYATVVRRWPHAIGTLEKRILVAPTADVVSSTAGGISGGGKTGTLACVVEKTKFNPITAGSKITFDPSVVPQGRRSSWTPCSCLTARAARRRSTVQARPSSPFDEQDNC